MLNVIDYMPGTTLLHKLHPVAKVALAAAIIAATFLSRFRRGLAFYEFFERIEARGDVVAKVVG